MTNPALLPRWYDRQLHKARLVSGAVNALGRLTIVRRFREQNVRHKRLRIAVVQRKPGGLYLHHDLVAGQKHVVRGRQRELIRERPVRRDGLRLAEALAIASAEG